MCEAMMLLEAYWKSTNDVILVLFLDLKLLRLNNIPSILYALSMSGSNWSSIKRTMTAMNIPNRVGAMIHPCLTPELPWNVQMVLN